MHSDSARPAAAPLARAATSHAAPCPSGTTEIVFVTHVCTPAVQAGFLPAAKALGLRVVVLTDCAQAHREQFARPGLPAYPDEIVACDVFNPLALLDAITRRPRRPAAVFSNSDHLQASTAAAARYLGLPGKSWQTAYRAKNKAEMRAQLAAAGIDTLWHAQVCDAAGLEALREALPWPCIVKPREGVASQHVGLAGSADELGALCGAIWAAQPGLPLLLEQYVDGPLYTLETLGDGCDVVALGGFQVTLSPPPHFVELEARWDTGLDARVQAQVLETVRRFGVDFGACHTEFVVTDAGPRLIEINYRSIGDQREFLMCEALRLPLFEQVLRLHLGERLPRLAPEPQAARIRYFVASSGGTLHRAPEAFTRCADALRLEFTPLRARGERIALTHSNRDYLGVLRGAAPDARRLHDEFERVGAALAWEIAA